MDTEFRQRKPLNEYNNNLTAEDAKSHQNESVRILFNFLNF